MRLTSTDDLNLTLRILAEHPDTSAEHFLEAKGLGTVAAFVRQDANRSPIHAAAVAAE